MKVHVCNNDDNGNWTNEITMFEFETPEETALRLETRSMFPVKADVFDCSFAVQQLKMHGVTVKCSLVGTWTGNMMCNTIEMLDDYALGLIRALQLSGQWSAVEGWEVPFEKFNSGEVVTGVDFELYDDVQPRVVNPNQLEINF